MGEDKASLRPPALAGRTLLENAVHVLDGLAGRVVLACGQDPRYAELGRELVLDSEPGAGPLAGLVAALDGMRGEWLLVLACDMPRADPGLFRALLEKAREEDLDLCLLESPDGLEPLCGVYRKTCGDPARGALRAGKRKVVSFHGPPLRRGSLSPSEVGSAEEWAINLNTRADFERELERGPEEMP